MATDNREIRVFISSTFLDMQAERELLVKEVFPDLRRVCLDRFVTFTEIDLRWGITEEEAAEGRVLPICLEEIRACRPFFIGILGERYGWVPSSIPAEALPNEPWLQEQIEYRKSVTELEVLHGVLNDPGLAEHAFFYFRDPAYVAAVPEKDRPRFEEHDQAADIERLGSIAAAARTAERRSRLRELKQRIRESGFPLLDGYADPRALADAVRGQFLSLIDAIYPPQATPHPLDREAVAHRAFAARKLLAYVDRPDHREALDTFVDNRAEAPGLVLIGEPGVGKTALLAHWTREYREQHPDRFVFEHYFGSTGDRDSTEGFLARLLGECKRLSGIMDDVPSDVGEMARLLPDWLGDAFPPGGRTGLLVLDGLDQIEGDAPDRQLAFLPDYLPSGLRIVTSTLGGESLSALRKRGWSEHTLDRPDAAERARMIDRFFEIYRKNPGADLRNELTEAEGTDNPLFLRTVLEELRQFGSFERLPDQVRHYLEARGPGALFRKVIDRWESDFGARDLVARSLRYLWGARAGLSEPEWLELLEDEDGPMDRQTLRPFFLALEPHLVRRSGLWAFGHQFLNRAVRERLLTSDLAVRRTRDQLAKYFEGQPAMSRRKAQELPWLLQQIDERDRLYGCLIDPTYVHCAMDGRTGEAEVLRFWAHLESVSDYTSADVLEAYRRHPEADPANGASVATFLLNAGHAALSLELRQRLRVLWPIIAAAADADPNQIRYFAAGALREEAQALSELGRFAEALERLSEAEAHLEALGDRSGLMYNFLDTAQSMLKSGRAAAAGSYVRRGASLARELGNDRLARRFRGLEADLHRSRGDHESAAATLREIVDELREKNDVRSLAAALGDRGRALTHLRRLKEAWECHHEEERLSRELGQRRGISAARFGKVNIMIEAGSSSEALELLDEILGSAMIGDERMKAMCLGTKARVLQERGEYSEAARLHTEEIETFRELQDYRSLAVALTNSSVLAHRRNRPEESREQGLEALRIAEEHGMDHLAAHVRNTLAALGR